jgi:hypothetical protein
MDAGRVDVGGSQPQDKLDEFVDGVYGAMDFAERMLLMMLLTGLAQVIY